MGMKYLIQRWYEWCPLWPVVWCGPPPDRPPLGHTNPFMLGHRLTVNCHLTLDESLCHICFQVKMKYILLCHVSQECDTRDPVIKRGAAWVVYFN